MAISSKDLISRGVDSIDAKTKHWVCCLANEKEMRRQAESWAGNRTFSFGEDYDLLRLSKNGFAKISNDSVLHFYCHGSKDLTLYHGNDRLAPKDFLEFLKKNGLSSKHKFIQLDACYSDKFAEEFAKIAKDDFPELCVSGFPGQFILCQGDNFENLANLEKPYVRELSNGLWELDKEEFAKAGVNKDDYIADKHKKRFYTQFKVNQELKDEVSANEASVSHPSRKATRSSSIVAAFSSMEIKDSSEGQINKNTEREAEPSRLTASVSASARQVSLTKSGYTSIRREDIPGRKSWSEVLNSSSAPVNANSETNTNLVQEHDSIEDKKSAWDKLVKESLRDDNIEPNENVPSPGGPKV